MTELHNDERGTLRVEGNETIQDSKVADASKFRVGAPYEKGESGGGGGFVFDVIGGLPNRPNGSPPPERVEVAHMLGALNDTGGGEWSLGLTKPGTWADISDEAQFKVIEATATKIEFKVPITAPNMNAPTLINRLHSGRFVYQLQDDPASGPLGRIVIYDTHGTSDETQWRAVGVLTPTAL